MLKIVLECKHCGMKEMVESLPFLLGDWLIHRRVDVFCSMACVNAWGEVLRTRMQEGSREPGRKIVWAKGENAGTIMGITPGPEPEHLVAPAQGGSG